MLDQNTDRMWFVIGALVVGAGIILLANNMVPELFAKVTGSMKNVSDNAIKELSQFKENYITNGFAEKSFIGFGNFYDLTSNKHDLVGKSLLVTFEAKHAQGSNAVAPHSYIRKSIADEKIYSGTLYYPDDKKKTTTEYQSFSIVIPPSGVPTNIENFALLTIRKADNTNTVYVRNVRLTIIE